MATDHLRRARRIVNDEFYTRYEDVERECGHYTAHFRGKTIYCNCDDPHWSTFTLFFLKNFRTLGIRRLISTCYNGEPGEGETPDFFAQPTGRGAWKLDIADCDGTDIDGFVSQHVEKLNGNGSFSSRECIALLRESDIVCTNPPFSLFMRFYALLLREKKDFLIIGAMATLSLRHAFRPIMAGSVYVEGFYECQFTPAVATCWYTTLKSDRVRLPRLFTKHYTPDAYPKLDNYNAINVSRSEDIPCDYPGIMGVPISFMEWYCPEQFVLISASPVIGDGPRLNGRDIFARIFIQKRGEPITEPLVPIPVSEDGKPFKLASQ